MPDSFARRQDLKKEEAACCVRFPPLLRQIYYIFRRKANVTFRVLTFARAQALASSAPKHCVCTLGGLCILRPASLRSLFHDSHLQDGRPLCRKSPCGSIETASKRKRNRHNPHRNRNNPPYHRAKIPIRSGRGAVAPRFFLPLPVTFSDNTAKVAASPLRITYIYL